VVLHKSPKKGGIGTGRFHRVDHVVKVAHAPAGGLESPKEGIIPRISGKSWWGPAEQNRYSHGIVQHSIHDLLVRASIRCVTVEDLADTVNTGSLVVAGPKGFLNMLNSINSQTIDFVIRR
jgi:hypothetical protein